MVDSDGCLNVTYPYHFFPAVGSLSRRLLLVHSTIYTDVVYHFLTFLLFFLPSTVVDHILYEDILHFIIISLTLVCISKISATRSGLPLAMRRHLLLRPCEIPVQEIRTHPNRPSSDMSGCFQPRLLPIIFIFIFIQVPRNSSLTWTFTPSTFFTTQYRTLPRVHIATPVTVGGYFTVLCQRPPLSTTNGC